MSASSEKKRRQSERQQGVVDKKVEAQREAEEKAKKSRLKWRVGTALLAVFVVLCIVLNTSLPFRMTAISVGDEDLSAAEMNYYYGNAYYNYSSYFSMFGVDPSLPLASQECMLLEEGTWHDYLLQQAVETARSLAALYQAAVAEGYELSEDGQAAVEETMSALPGYAESYGYETVDEYLKAMYGTGVTEELLREIVTKGNLVDEYTADKYYDLSYTEEEADAYYKENPDQFVTYDYLYYYIAAETEEVTNEDGTTSSEVVDGGVEEALAAAKEIAAKVTDRASFEEAVAQYSEGATVQTVSAAAESGISSTYRDWMISADRQANDVTTASSDVGAYVVMYVAKDDKVYPARMMRHILIQTVDADEDGTYSAEEQAAAKERVEEIEAEWLAGEKTALRFAELANQYSEDEGSNTTGGLYINIGKGDMVTEINDFLFAEGRKEGDTAIVYGNNGNYDGYHLVYYAGEGDSYHLALAEAAMIENAYSEWETGITDQYTADTGMGYNLIGK